MDEHKRETLLQSIVDEHGGALARLCRGYEKDASCRAELEQEILLTLWQSLPSFRGDASLRTWMYRVAHNVATRHVSRAMRRPPSTGSEDVAEDQPADSGRIDDTLDRTRSRERLHGLIAELKPVDRQLIMLYLEELPQSEIGAITGLSQANVSTRIHRIKDQLSAGMGQ